MLVRAVVVEMVDNCRARIRVPKYNKASGATGATPDSELPVAVICALPGITPNYKPGDAVFVSFENDNIGMPVILGVLSTSANNRCTSDIRASSIDVLVNAKLPSQTNVQGAGSNFWQYIRTLNQDVQNALNVLTNKVIKPDNPDNGEGETE